MDRSPASWHRYISGSRTNIGRATVEFGIRLDEAAKALDGESFTSLVRKAKIPPREVRHLRRIGCKLAPLLEIDPRLRLPVRLRTLSALAEVSAARLREAVSCGQVTPLLTEADVRLLRGVVSNTSESVICPSDNWNFPKLRWPRIDSEGGYGYLPGDLYANCLWYYSHPGDIVVDPMAGSGMLRRVWEDRAEWTNGECSRLDEPVLSDLVPRGPYISNIVYCDLMEAFPVDRADYIIIDPPYHGIASGQYSDLPNDLANMDVASWRSAVQQLAQLFRTRQGVGGRCTVVVPNQRSLLNGHRELFPDFVRRVFVDSGYMLYDVVYASRRVQRTQGARMAILNNRAKSARVPLSDVAEVLTFHLPG